MVATGDPYIAVDSVTGLCHNITSTVVVDVFYSRAGQSQMTPLYVLVGAKITYVH